MVLEVNPRLTTSYVGLRSHLNGNLAEWILNLAVGTAPFRTGKQRGRVAFSASGQCEIEISSDCWTDPSEFSPNRAFFL
jgi:predicted ATP-grasp superfamily ATP-dependent carboligase